MKKYVCSLAAAFFGAALLGAAETQVVCEVPCNDLKGWKQHPKDGVTRVSLDTAKEPGTTLLKLEFKIDDPKTAYAWPQTNQRIKPVETASGALAAEFDIFPEMRQGDLKLALSPRPMDAFRASPVNAKPGEWNHVVVPILPKKEGAVLDSVGFYIVVRLTKAGDEGAFFIKNFRLVRGAAAEAAVKAATAPAAKTAAKAPGLRPGILSQKVVPAASIPLDKRAEIMIPNLIVNGYFREGGDMLPPQGWGSSWGGETYGKGLHAGRTVKLVGRDNVKTMSLRQNGLVLVPGEPYKLSGYIRGDGFTGPMQGQIVTAGPRWSKTRGYFFSEKDIKPDWQYFEVVFTPEPSKSGEYEAIIYRTGAGGGWIEVDHLILEALSEKGIKGSRNKYTGDKFAENYARALKEGTFRQGPPSPDYKLVWSDEFDGDKVDESKWLVLTLDYKGKRPYRYVPQAAKLDGEGHLLMTTSLAADKMVEMPRLTTAKHTTFVGGYIECRFQLHDTHLANASFWMLPEGQMDYRDPVNKGMEIDIMECVQPRRDTISHTTHWYSGKGAERVSYSGGTRGRYAPGLSKGWHTVALEWTPTELIFSIDGVESWRLNQKDHPIPVKDHNIILSFGGRYQEIFALGGPFSTTFKIDYVRVYQKQDGFSRVVRHGERK